jgi:hypothetical protein
MDMQFIWAMQDVSKRLFFLSFEHVIKLMFLQFMQFQFTPQHLVRLLQIIVDGSCDMAVRQVASIHFKNFIAKNWSPNDPGLQMLLACR